MKLEWKSETDRLRDELISLRASYEEKMKAYKDLFDLKIKLDQELETYRQLLEAEENRWVLSQGADLYPVQASTRLQPCCSSCGELPF